MPPNLLLQENPPLPFLSSSSSAPSWSRTRSNYYKGKENGSAGLRWPTTYVDHINRLEKHVRSSRCPTDTPWPSAPSYTADTSCASILPSDQSSPTAIHQWLLRQHPWIGRAARCTCHTRRKPRRFIGSYPGSPSLLFVESDYWA